MSVLYVQGYWDGYDEGYDERIQGMGFGYKYEMVKIFKYLCA